MKVQDVSENRRIMRLTRLMRELEQSRTLEQAFETLQRAFSEIDGLVASLLLSTAGLPTGHYRLLRAELADQSQGACMMRANPPGS